MADEKSQLDKFKEAARELWYDDEARFKERATKLVAARKGSQKSETPGGP